MAKENESESDQIDKERAAGEGMHTAASNPSEKDAAPEHLLETPEFLDQVVEEFYEEGSSLATIEEAAYALVERQAMPEFAAALEDDGEGKLRGYLQAHLGDEAWQQLVEEELSRQMFTDKTIDGATPG